MNFCIETKIIKDCPHKNKKRQYKNNILDQMVGNETTNPKKYWKLLEKLSPKHKSENNHVSEKQWVNHYTNLLNSGGTTDYPDNMDEGELDHEISLNELDRTISQLKDGKSPGEDNISNEMIDVFIKSIPTYYLDF